MKTHRIIKRSFWDKDNIVVKLNPTREMPIIGVKIIDKQYSYDFVNRGVIHFSSPSDWANVEKATGHQLDIQEGCFCLSTDNNDFAVAERRRSFNKLVKDGFYRYYSDSSTVLACCFYGVNRSDFKKNRVRYGVEEVEALNCGVGLSYFTNFNRKGEKEKAVVIILDMPRFVAKLREALMKMGFDKEDILVSPVYYAPKKIPFYCREPFPFEYFLKDTEFSEQSELRVLINCKDFILRERLKANGNNVVIGDISSFVRSQDYYSEDLVFSIQGDNLLFNLATPEVTDLSDIPFEGLVSILLQIRANKWPGPPLTKEEIDAHLEVLRDVLWDKYKVLYSREYETFFNVNDELRAKLDAIFGKK